MKKIDEIKSNVMHCLAYNYPGNPDDEQGGIDKVWINKKQKYEVAYAIAYCLIQCNAETYSKNVIFVQRLEKMIQEMDHDGKGRCLREKAYPELNKAIKLLMDCYSNIWLKLRQ